MAQGLPSAHPWRGVEHPRAGVGRGWHCGSSGTAADGLAAHILVGGRCVHADSISLPLAKINDACHCGRCQIGHRCSGPSAPPVAAVRSTCLPALTTRATFSWWGPGDELGTDEGPRQGRQEKRQDLNGGGAAKVARQSEQVELLGADTSTTVSDGVFVNTPHPSPLSSAPWPSPSCR